MTGATGPRAAPVTRWQRAFYHSAKPIVRLASLLLLRLRAYSPENVPQHGGALLLSNHQSYLDPVLIGAASPRRLLFMARDSLFQSTLFGLLIRSLGAFPVAPDRPDKTAIRRAIDSLAAGELVLMFPEGTRSYDGDLLPVKGGFQLLVRRASVPVVPVVLDGAYRAWPRTERLPRPARVQVIFGTAILPDEFVGLSDNEAAGRVSRELGQLLARLRRSQT